MGVQKDPGPDKFPGEINETRLGIHSASLCMGLSKSQILAQAFIFKDQKILDEDKR